MDKPKPQTQAHMGRGELVDRLTAQTGSRETAIALLRARGQMEAHSEQLTPAGQARNNMTAEERAKDRAAKKSGNSVKAYKYNPASNRATLKR